MLHYTHTHTCDDNDIDVDTCINIDQGNDILNLAYVIEMNTVLDMVWKFRHLLNTTANILSADAV